MVGPCLLPCVLALSDAPGRALAAPAATAFGADTHPGIASAAVPSEPNRASRAAPTSRPSSRSQPLALHTTTPAIASEPTPAPATPTAGTAAPGLQSEEATLAKELANPVASLISVPFQFNVDGRIGTAEEIQAAILRIQPVIPLRLNGDWNLISRTILPVLNVQGPAGPESGQPHFGDTLQSLFLSPARPGPGGVIWGVGPAALLATATADLSGGQQWGLGPTGVALVQRGRWTAGTLANHLWSVANGGPSADLNSTYLQPFLSYTTANAWTVSLNSESTYDWAADQWAVPLNLVVSKVGRLGHQLLSVGAGARYWVQSPEGGPRGWGGRVVVTLLFPSR
jgi:hypothetical protein